MPLLVLFSKCLHLVFAPSDSNERVTISEVPIMANVMYLADDISLEDSSQPYFFGATIPAVPHSSPDKHFKNLRGLVSTWRRNILIEPALHAHQQSLPRLDPSIRNALGACLDAIIRGYPEGTDDTRRQSLHSDIYEYSRPIRELVLKKDSLSNSAVVKPERLLTDKRTRATLRPLLNQVISFVYSDNYNRKDPHMHNVFQQLLCFYVCPHVYRNGKSQGQTATEIIPDAQERAAINDLVNNMWQPSSKVALDKLEYLKMMQEEYENPPASQVFSRCAEAYPAVVVQ
jgi:hypothetical protein